MKKKLCTLTITILLVGVFSVFLSFTSVPLSALVDANDYTSDEKIFMPTTEKKVELSLNSGSGIGDTKGPVFGFSTTFKYSKNIFVEGEFYYYTNPFDTLDIPFELEGSQKFRLSDQDTQAINLNFSVYHKLFGRNKSSFYISYGFGIIGVNYKGIVRTGSPEDKSRGVWAEEFYNVDYNFNNSVGISFKYKVSDNFGLRLDGKLFYVYFQDYFFGRVTMGVCKYL